MLSITKMEEKDRRTIERYMKARGIKGVPKMLIGTKKYMELSVRVAEIKNNDGGKEIPLEEWLKKIYS